MPRVGGQKDAAVMAGAKRPGVPDHESLQQRERALEAYAQALHRKELELIRDRTNAAPRVHPVGAPPSSVSTKTQRRKKASQRPASAQRASISRAAADDDSCLRSIEASRPWPAPARTAAARTGPATPRTPRTTAKAAERRAYGASAAPQPRPASARSRPPDGAAAAERSSATRSDRFAASERSLEAMLFDYGLDRGARAEAFFAADLASQTAKTEANILDAARRLDPGPAPPRHEEPQPRHESGRGTWAPAAKATPARGASQQPRVAAPYSKASDAPQYGQTRRRWFQDVPPTEWFRHHHLVDPWIRYHASGPVFADAPASTATGKAVQKKKKKVKPLLDDDVEAASFLSTSLSEHGRTVLAHRRQRSRGAVKFQAAVRGWLARRRAHRTRRKRAKAKAREHAKRWVRATAAQTLQRRWRGGVGREKARRARDAARLDAGRQRDAERRTSRNAIVKRLRHFAALQLQARLCRGPVARAKFAILRQKDARHRNAARRRAASTEISRQSAERHRRKQSASILQAFLRGFVARGRFEKLKRRNAAILRLEALEAGKRGRQIIDGERRRAADARRDEQMTDEERRSRDDEERRRQAEDDGERRRLSEDAAALRRSGERRRLDFTLQKARRRSAVVAQSLVRRHQARRLLRQLRLRRDAHRTAAWLESRAKRKLADAAVAVQSWLRGAAAVRRAGKVRRGRARENARRRNAQAELLRRADAERCYVAAHLLQLWALRCLLRKFAIPRLKHRGGLDCPCCRKRSGKRFARLFNAEAPEDFNVEAGHDARRAQRLLVEATLALVQRGRSKGGSPDFAQSR
ncbi:hypothetical protein M885DRAFT_507309 [Pelagophyceae sp. CCMP2097]|nr:hypothetical protein M885DRAFT_507309 [Pelagophyceae sp. CCMP2097]